MRIYAAVDTNNNLYQDMDALASYWAYLKRETLGKTIVYDHDYFMDQLGGVPLPFRTNIIYSKTITHVANATVFNDPAILGNYLEASRYDDNVVVLGDEELFRLALPYVYDMLVTKVDVVVDGAPKFCPLDDFLNRNVTNVVDKGARSDLSYVTYLYVRNVLPTI